MSNPSSNAANDPVHTAIFAGRKIEAIKLYRRQSGVGLAEAKQHVEALERELRAAGPERYSGPRPAWGSMPRWMAVGFVISGLLFVAWGAYESWPQWRGTFGMPRAEGTLVEVAPAGGDGEVLVIDYQVDGRPFRTRHRVLLGNMPHQRGEKIPVRYSPDRPQEGVADTFSETWGLLLILGGCGGLFVLVGALALRAGTPRPATA